MDDQDPLITINRPLTVDPGESIPLGAIEPSNPAAGMTAGAMGMSILSGLLKGMASVQAGEYNADVAENNAKVARLAAGDARARGQYAAQLILLKGSQLASKQKAAYAGNGVAVSSGSAVDAMSDTKGMSAFDALMAENNAAREAWGLEQRGKQFDEEAAIERARAKNQLGESILGGAAGAATIYRDYLFKTS